MMRSLAVVALLGATLAGPSVTTADAAAGCASTATKRFIPKTVAIEGVSKATVVYARPRDYAGVPGTPPMSAKQSMAWDAPGAKPGGKRGNVMFNAHTWPDGSALGNRLLAQLQVGDNVRVRGAIKSERICYRVIKRYAIAANDVAEVRRIYNYKRKSRVVIVVCSGTRLGPGNWTHRTIWVARR